MGPGTVAVVVEGVLLALALLFIVALLRSHADILRRLGALEGGPGAVAARKPNGGERASTAGSDIVGVTLAGDSVKIGLGPTSSPTLLAFLSSGCAACGPLWSGLHQPIALPFEARLVVVTKGPEGERPARLLELAPSDAEVVMSSAAWDAFAVPATPHFVLVAGREGVAGRGGASSWQQIATLLGDARDDGVLLAARTTAARAARAQEALAGAGITSGHPSLYPSRESRQAPPSER